LITVVKYLLILRDNVKSIHTEHVKLVSDLAISFFFYVVTFLQ